MRRLRVGITHEDGIIMNVDDTSIQLLMFTVSIEHADTSNVNVMRGIVRNDQMVYPRRVEGR